MLFYYVCVHKFVVPLSFIERELKCVNDELFWFGVMPTHCTC